jgi:hypothetical protein
MSGRELKNLIKEKYKFDCDNFKLIYNGKLIKDDLNLNSQELKVSYVYTFSFSLSFTFSFDYVESFNYHGYVYL